MGLQTNEMMKTISTQILVYNGHLPVIPCGPCRPCRLGGPCRPCGLCRPNGTEGPAGSCDTADVMACTKTKFQNRVIANYYLYMVILVTMWYNQRSKLAKVILGQACVEFCEMEGLEFDL